MFAAEGLSRAEWLHRRRSEQAAARADHHGSRLTGEQIREKAHQSWGLLYLPARRQNAA